VEFGDLTRPERPLWMAPALQEFFGDYALACQYSRLSGLFARRLPLALMSSASEVPIGFATFNGHAVRRSVLALG